LDLEHLVPIAAAVAVGAAQVDVRKELHLDVLEAIAVARRTTAVAGVEAERTGAVLALLRGGLRREEVAYGIERADVTRGIGAGGAADRGLIDHDDIVDELGAGEPGEESGRLGRLAVVFEESGIEHVLDQRGLAGAGDAGDTDEALQWNPDIHVLEVVLSRAAQFQPAIGAGFGDDLAARADARGDCRALGADSPLAAQVLPREGGAVAPDLA